MDLRRALLIERLHRYMLNNFKVLLSEGSAGRMTREDFLTEPIPTSPFMVDAAYAFVIAINNLLNAGVAPQDTACIVAT